MLPNIDVFVQLPVILMYCLNFIRLSLARPNINDILDLPNFPDITAIMNLIMQFLNISKKRQKFVNNKKKSRNLVKLLRNYRY